MIFLWLGSIIAWLSLIVGAVRFGAGLYIVSIENAEVRASLANRYLGSVEALTEGFDQGLLLFVFGVVLGVLVEIARSLRRN